MCEKCHKLGAGLVLVVGICFLMQDLNIWNFWGISWYTIAFIMAGLMCMGSTCCKVPSKKR